MFAANDSICTATRDRASVKAASIDSRVSGVPLATTWSPRYSVSSSSRTTAPSATRTITSGPTPSMTGIPASSSSCGPRFGYRPVMLIETLTTAAIFRLISSSALTRSRSE